MEKFELDKIRSLPIESVAERLGLKVKAHRCLCCFHDDHTPSMSFSVSRNTFRCWSCGAHGGVIDLTMKVLGTDSFVEACKWLADENNIILTMREASPPSQGGRVGLFDVSRFKRYFEHPWLSDDAKRFLFDERHLHPAVVRFCRLNSYKDWLQIPYYNIQGQLVGVQRRYMGTDKNQPRFRFPRGEQCHLYNQQVISMLEEGEQLYIGEGPSDVWALLSSGKKAIGIPSATMLKTTDLAAITQHLPSNTQLHIYPDKDEAGEALYHKLLTAANELGLCLIRHDLPEGCKDFAEQFIIHSA